MAVPRTQACAQQHYGARKTGPVTGLSRYGARNGLRGAATRPRVGPISTEHSVNTGFTHPLRSLRQKRLSDASPPGPTPGLRARGKGNERGAAPSTETRGPGADVLPSEHIAFSRPRTFHRVLGAPCCLGIGHARVTHEVGVTFLFTRRQKRQEAIDFSTGSFSFLSKERRWAASLLVPSSW